MKHRNERHAGLRPMRLQHMAGCDHRA